uniref:Uncharacterized protein n=1 Tax=Odontella aurita TaxID=265563 RepID=A0A7S4MAZ1_9STRA|mmetsp:Transcript_1607/g.4319  ORF Transcript_1607/g.4319 Transcript_1607/m.4319 type:complete len:287 (+) Transcript_1607:132-992(+)
MRARKQTSCIPSLLTGWAVTTILLCSVLFPSSQNSNHGFSALAFTAPAIRATPNSGIGINRRRSPFVVLGKLAGDDADSEVSDAPLAALVEAAFPASTPAALPASTSDKNDHSEGADVGGESSPSLSLSSSPSDDELLSSSSSSTTTFMITSEMRRVLIEELRYTRAEVESMRVELAGPVIAKRVSRPPGGMPESWYTQEEGGGDMLSRLENESKYPLKVPLLGISLILGGKGLGDLIITLIKVNTGFPGASLTEKFMGINVLGIDVLCVLAGIGLGLWTWKTMKD